MGECMCTKEKEIEEIRVSVKNIERGINGNGKIGMAAKVEMLWSDRVSRNRFLENTATWLFRAILVFLIWGKVPK